MMFHSKSYLYFQNNLIFFATNDIEILLFLPELYIIKTNKIRNTENR